MSPLAPENHFMWWFDAGYSCAFALSLCMQVRPKESIRELVNVQCATDLLVVVLSIVVGAGGLAMPFWMGANASDALAGDSDLSYFRNAARSMLTVYMWLVGEWDVEAINKHIVAAIFFYTFVLMTTIVMLNLLIAIMSDSYDKVRDQLKVQQRIVMAQIIHDIESSLTHKRKELKQHWFWKRMPKRFRPWCVDSSALAPPVVLVVRRKDGGGTDDTEWTGRLNKMRKNMEDMEQKEDENGENDD